MGCSASKQTTHFDAPPAVPEKQVARTVPAAGASSSAAAGAGGDSGPAEDQPKFGEVVQESYLTCDLPMNGLVYKLDINKYSYPNGKGTKAERDADDREQYGAPPVPPALSEADEERGLEFCNSQPFSDISREIARAALAWGPPNADAVFIRLTATDKSAVTADAAFIVAWNVIMPHEVHNSVEKQQELFQAMLPLWYEVAEGRTTGTDHPGDMVLLYKRDGAMTLEGCDWKPNTYQGALRRELWVPHLKAFCERQRLKDAEQDQFMRQTQAFIGRFNPVMGSMISDILTWPPVDGAIGFINITVVHVKGRGPSARVTLSDAGENDITNMDTASLPDPTLLQDMVARRWVDVCANGVPDEHHPPMVMIKGPAPTVGGPEGQLRLTFRWGEDGFSDDDRATVAQVYRLRPDEAPRAAPPKRFSLGSLFKHAGDQDAFMAPFQEAMSGMLSAAFTWRPADGVAKVVVMLAQMPQRGTAARVAIFDGTGACYVGMSADGRAPRALHDEVGTMWADFCAANPNDLPITITVTCKPGSVTGAGQMSASFDLRGIWRAEDLSPADKIHLALLYGEHPDQAYSAMKGGSVPVSATSTLRL